MAIGSKRSWPTAPAAAAVVSTDIVAPRKTPCSQSNAWWTSGTTVARRPPNRNASIGTPSGSSHSSLNVGQFRIETVKREFGCAAGSSESGAQSRARQSIACAGFSSVIPSHHVSPSSVSAVLVKIASRAAVWRAFGLVAAPVPGATPKKPASGLTA